jgi:Rad3-related DNA helicase
MTELLNTFIPKELDLPAKYTQFRTNQAEAIDKIVNSDKNSFLLDSPTGFGKSLVAIASYKRLDLKDRVIDRMTGNENRYRCIYLTRTIQLQSQILDDFPGVMVKGRKNYPCAKRPADFNLLGDKKFTAEDCPGKESCNLPCAYHTAKLTAAKAPLAVLNDAYYLSEINGPGLFAGANMVVVDEIDSMENSVLDIIKFTISERQCKKYNLSPPDKMDDLPTWKRWVMKSHLQVEQVIAKIQDSLPSNVQSWTDVEIKLNKEVKSGGRFLHKMQLFIDEVNDTWIIDIDPKTKSGGWLVTFKPVTVGPYCQRYLWRFGKRFLGMSGTILDPVIMAEDLGIENYDYHRLDSTFPVNNRLMHYRPVANLSFDKMEAQRPNTLAEIARIILAHPGENILVHAVNWKLRDYLVSMLPFSGVDPKNIITHEKETRAERLEYFKTQRGLTMISPSFDRGVSLEDDACRVVIIAKIPYMNTQDKQVKARLAMAHGQRWYSLKAIQTVMQMSGRAVRSEEDFAETHIIDQQFDRLLARTRHMIPKWWLSAIRREEV